MVKTPRLASRPRSLRNDLATSTSSGNLGCSVGSPLPEKSRDSTPSMPPVASWAASSASRRSRPSISEPSSRGSAVRILVGPLKQ